MSEWQPIETAPRDDDLYDTAAAPPQAGMKHQPSEDGG